MIFEPTQLCFSSNYTDDFRGLTTVKELLYAVIPPPEIRRQEVRCFSNFENIGAISQDIIAGVIKCVRHTYTAIIKAEGSVFYE